MSIFVTARQISTDAIDAVEGRRLAEEVIADFTEFEVRRVDALRLVERVAGNLIEALSQAQAAYFASADDDESLWADVVIADAALEPYAAFVDKLERLAR